MSLAIEAPPPRPHPFLSYCLKIGGRYDEIKLEHTLRGKTVLITGASHGIGRALALRLGRAGGHMVLAPRTMTRLQEICDEIAAFGGKARAFALDLTQPQSIQALADQLAAEGVVPEIVVHNAGKSIRRSIALSLDRLHDFQRTIGTNYMGPVQLQLALLPAMMARRSGHILFVSSIGVRLPPAPLWSAYTASKSAFDTWMRCIEPELAAYGITCTCVYFGLVFTRMMAPTRRYHRMPGMTADEAAATLCRAILKRPRKVAPWWLFGLTFLALWFEGLLFRVWRLTYRRKGPS